MGSESHYTEIAETFSDNPLYDQSEWNDQLAQHVIANGFGLNQDTAKASQDTVVIADIGGGPGTFSALLHKHLLQLGYTADRVKVVCVEPCEQLLVEGRKQNTDVVFECADGNSWLKNQSEGSINFMLVKEAVHHFSIPALGELYKLAHRALVRRGRCVTITRPKWIDLPWFEAARDSFAQSQYASEDILQCQTRAGLEVSDISTTRSMDIPTNTWLAMLNNKFWSNLSALPADVLEKGVSETRKRLGATEHVEFVDKLVIFSSNRL